MRIIKTQQDFEVLRNSRAPSALLLDQIEDYFLHLRDELEAEAEANFVWAGTATSSFSKRETTSATSVTSG